MENALNRLMAAAPVLDTDETTATTVIVTVLSIVALVVFLLAPKRDTAIGKCILITGCDSGFGALLTAHASREGFTVIAACLTQEGATKASSSGATNVTAVVADLTTKQGRMAVVDKTKQVCEPFGGLYAIVNNAGFLIPGLIDMIPPEVYEKTMSVMFQAPVELNYELLPSIKQVQGRVICVSSVAGFVAFPANAPYSAAKHALEAYCDALRVEMRPWGVKVVLIEPSSMKTPIVESNAEAFKQTYLNARPDRQEQYGTEWMETNYEAIRANIVRASEDPNIVVRDLMDSLLLTKPPSRIISGRIGRFIMKPISRLPDSVRDVILYYTLMGGGKPIPKGLQEEQR